MDDPIDLFLQHPAWQGINRARLVPFAEQTNVVRRSAGSLITCQYHPADSFYLLAAGSVRHEVMDESGHGSLLGNVDWGLGAIGWAGFLAPRRYTTTATVDTEAVLLSWCHDDLATLFYADPSVAEAFLRLVADSVYRQFSAVREQQLAGAGRALPPATADPQSTPRRRVAPAALTVLRRSPFFRHFEDRHLTALARAATLRFHDAGALIVHQDETIDGLQVLASGAVDMCFQRDPHRQGPRVYRSLEGGGALIAGSPALGGHRAEASVYARTPASVYCLPAAALRRLSADDPEFGRSLVQRLLFRLAQLLSSARALRCGENADADIAAVSAMIHFHRLRLPAVSALYKLPHLLANPMTVGNALATLRTSRESNDYVERSVALSCTNLLDGVRREHEFLWRVMQAYQDVLDAPEDTPPARLRDTMDRRVAEAFDQLDLIVRGRHRLPRSGGTIFILNHLACPAYYQFPNGYHFSFDTALVGALVHQASGRSAIRVVRESPRVEFGHSMYYRRLGHIRVPTEESEPAADADAYGDSRRRAADELLRQGRAALAAGDSLIICPEGSSQPAQRSPARFFSGAFRLALSAFPEPDIVPVALANLDKRYKAHRLAVVVGRPFKFSAWLAACDPPAIRPAVDALQAQFAGLVNEARRLTASPEPASHRRQASPRADAPAD